MPELTAAEIANLEYLGPSPGTKGFAGEDALAYHQAHGEQFRVWPGYLSPEGQNGPNGEVREGNGRIYIEENLSPAVRGLITEDSIQVNDRDFGVITVWQTKISVLPWQIQLVRGDRVLLTELHRAKPDRCLLQPGKSELPVRWISEISRVIVDSEDFGDYDLEIDDDGKSRLLGLPNSSICSVKFKYQPLYVWSDIQNRTAPKGTDGLALPQIGILTQKKR